MDHGEYLDQWWEANWRLFAGFPSPRVQARRSMLRHAVLWDLDSTVSRTLSRRPMIDEIKAGRKTWEDYSLACGGDEPIEANVTLMKAMPQYVHVALSGRSAAAHDMTRAWCERFRVPLQALLLRPAGDSTPNGDWKVEAIRYLLVQGLRIVCMFEDWQPVAEYIMEQTGLPVICVNPCDPEESRLPYAPGAAAISESL